jgi:carboxylesterase type B
LPINPEPWKGVRDVFEHNSRCPQLDRGKYVGDQDCLTLSVFASNSTTKAGVLFYIHESDMVSGSGDPTIYGPEYIVEKGIVLVLPNYRLGALGFLCLRNETAQGNAALKDLTLALEWTKNNIEAFGGDSENIVVSGDGTSAALAGYLALSPKSNKYVSKVITDSGSVLSHWAIDREPVDTAMKLAYDIKKMYNETYNADDDDIFHDINIEHLIIAANNRKFQPCSENKSNESFIEVNPWTILNNEIINITFIIGSANHAGLREAIQYDSESLLEWNDDFATALPNDLVFKDQKIKSVVVDKIKVQYFGTDNITLSKLENVSLYYSDVSYIGPDLRVAKALVKAGATVYLYKFSFMGELNKELHTIDHQLHFGATRGDIVGYLFTQDCRMPVENTKEKRTVELMTDMWVSFIKEG